MKLYGRSARTITPGQGDQIKVSLPTRNRSGLISRTIRVTTNDPAHRSVSLLCSGRVLRAFGGGSPAVSFGRIQRTADVAKKTFTIRRGDGGPISPKLGKIKHTGVAAELRTIAAGSEYQVDVTITPPWPNGRLTTVIPVQTGVAKAPMEYLRVVADVEPRLRTQPQRFDVPLLEDPVARSVGVLWSSDGGTKQILSADPSDSRLSARVEMRNGLQTVVLDVPGGYKPSSRPVAVALRTDDEEIPVFSVPVRFDKPRPVSNRRSTRRSSPVRRKKKCDTSPNAAPKPGESSIP